MTMHWTTARILEFLNLLEQEPIIWHPRHPSCRDSYELRKSWFRIRSRMTARVTVSELKRKRDSLMKTFRSITNKIKGSGDNNYRTNWFAYETMVRFLGDIYQVKSKEDTKNSFDFIKLELPEFIKDDSNASVAEDLYDEDADNDALADNDASVSVSSKTSNTYVATTSKLPAQESHLNRQKDSCLCQSQSRDECSLYSQLLAKKLRSFDEYTREVLMNEIDNFVFGVKRRRTSLNVVEAVGQNVFDGYAIDQGLLEDQKL